jgi:predicted MFS family arabinose efflux permease
MPLVGGVVVEYLGLLALGIFGMALMVPALLFLLKLREPSPGVYEDPSAVETASV